MLEEHHDGQVAWGYRVGYRPGSLIAQKPSCFANFANFAASAYASLHPFGRSFEPHERGGYPTELG